MCVFFGTTLWRSYFLSANKVRVQPLTSRSPFRKISVMRHSVSPRLSGVFGWPNNVPEEFEKINWLKMTDQKATSYVRQNERVTDDEGAKSRHVSEGFRSYIGN